PQSAGGIPTTGGMAPPTVTPLGNPIPPAGAPAAGVNSSSLMPSGSSMNSLNGAIPVSTAAVSGRQVAVNAVRTTDPSARAGTAVPAAPAANDLPVAMPPAPAGSDVPALTPPQITHLSPVTLQPTTV